MSGLPGGRNAGIPAATQDVEREMVFCHSCQNEWFRNEHGLICPGCQSDFTEILENNLSDPRPGLDVVDDDDDEDYGDEMGEHPPFMVMGTGAGPSIVFSSSRSFHDGTGPIRTETRTYRSGGNSPMPDRSGSRGSSRPDSPGGGPGDIASMFTSMFEAIAGNGLHPQPGDRSGSQQDPGSPQPPGSGPQSPTSGTPEANPPNRRGPVVFRSSFQTFGGPIPSLHVHGPHVAFGAAAPNGGGSPDGGPGQVPLGDIAGLLSHLLGIPLDQGNDAFMRVMGVANGTSGDYAWSQADMDRIMSQLMDQHGAPTVPPAPDTVINSLPKVLGEERKAIPADEDCVVCRDTLVNAENDEVVKLPCKHIYHFECVKKWLEAHDSCPVCRTPITPEDQRPAAQQPNAQQQQQPGGGSPFGLPFGSFGGFNQQNHGNN